MRRDGSIAIQRNTHVITIAQSLKISFMRCQWPLQVINKSDSDMQSNESKIKVIIQGHYVLSNYVHVFIYTIHAFRVRMRKIFPLCRVEIYLSEIVIIAYRV
jgi:hypothetical protein